MFLQHRLCPQKPGEERTRPEGFPLLRATDEDFPRAHVGARPRGPARRVLLWKRIREAGKRGCKWTVPEAGSVERLSSRCFPREAARTHCSLPPDPAGKPGPQGRPRLPARRSHWGSRLHSPPRVRGPGGPVSTRWREFATTDRWCRRTGTTPSGLWERPSGRPRVQDSWAALLPFKSPSPPTGRMVPGLRQGSRK